MIISKAASVGFAMWADPDMICQTDARSVIDHDSGDHASVSIRQVVRGTVFRGSAEKELRWDDDEKIDNEPHKTM